MTESASELLIGAHTSAAGGVQNALLEGQSIGATTIQLFTSNQRQWKSKELSAQEIALWKKTLADTGLKKIMSHDSYLINLGAPDEENLVKSRESFAAEAKRCVQLGITFLNFHPGASLKGDPQQCLDKIIESILLVKPIVEQGSVRLLLEATAGQGSSIGASFEELAYILKGTHNQVPIGVCIDTCHIFAAGYDIRTPAAWDKTLDDFDRVVGLNHLYAFHVNDSMKDLGTRVDRHAPLGEGKIGLESFKYLMKNPRTRSIPKYLETPGGPELWEKEIRMLRELA